MQYLGKLLVAVPGQKDPFWAKTVVWLYEYNQGSYAGLIINKPSPKTVSELAKHHKIRWNSNRPLHIGGPMNPSALILLHNVGWRTPNTQLLDHSNVCLSSHATMLDRLAMGDEPESWRLILGICGWAPSQLEQELARPDGWMTTDFNADLLWDTRRPEVIWHQALDQATHQAVDKLFEI